MYDYILYMFIFFSLILLLLIMTNDKDNINTNLIFNKKLLYVLFGIDNLNKFYNYIIPIITIIFFILCLLLNKFQN